MHQTINSKRQKVMSCDEGRAIVMQQTGQQYVIAGKEIHYNEFLKRACRQTSIPIKMLHFAICNYARTNNLDGSGKRSRPSRPGAAQGNSCVMFPTMVTRWVTGVSTARTPSLRNLQRFP